MTGEIQALAGAQPAVVANAGQSQVAPPAVTPAATAAPATSQVPAVAVDPAKPAVAVDPAKPAVTATPAQTPEQIAAEAKAKEDAAKAGAPAKYDLKLAEGLQANEAALTEFQGVAKDLNLTNEQAQKIIDLQNKFALADVKEQETRWNSFVDGLETEARADPKIGGAAFEDNCKLAKQAIARFADPAEMDAFFAITGAGNSKALIRFASAVGKAMSEGAVPGGGAGTGTGERKDTATVLFDAPVKAS